ncbi:hypothetical protein EPN54_01725 [bacterium]|nr:MAG: hypothetical protein EPN54_01725 [bacterium]
MIKIKRFNFPKLFLITVTVISLIASFAALYDNDDPTFDLLCKDVGPLPYQYILADFMFSKGRLYEYGNTVAYEKPLISYLAGKEKSPPLLSSTAAL